MKPRFLPLFTPDSGAPAGGAPAPAPAAPPPAPAPAPAAPGTADAGGQPPANGGTTPARTFTQAELDQIIADRLDRQKRSLEAAAAQQRTAAEQAALAEQGQFKTLAEQRAAELETLKPAAERAERYEKALRAQLDAQRQGLPAHILPLLDKMDVAEQLEYLAANRASLLPPAPPAAPDTNAGGGKTPPPPDPEAEKRKQDELRRRFPALGRR